jgi:serine/threonine-protein kinase
VRGFVHRDVSPQNTLIGWDGAVKVTDFGLAKARVTTKASASLWVKGKPGYVSPEQANGDALDGRSDLFSVGIMLWEMICGERLFDRGTAEATLRSLLLEPVPSPRSRAPKLPEDIERITMRLLERDRSRRHQTAGAAIGALLACAAYPKNGRELVSSLLGERLPARARQRSAGATRSDELLPSSDEETVIAPPIAPLLAPGEPYPDPPALGRARRIVLLASLVVAMAFATILVLRSVLRVEDNEAQAVPTTRVVSPSEPRMNQRPQPQDEQRAITTTSALLQSSPVPAAPALPAPTLAPQPLPTKAAAGRVPARSRQAPSATSPAPAGGNGIRMIDLRDLAPMPAGHEERGGSPR